MNRTIVWSPASEKDFAGILEYLDSRWGIDVTNRFIDKLDGILEHIKRNPGQYPLIFKKLKIRKCVITKHNTLYYRYNQNQIEILRIYDTRQDPRKLNFH
jgi:plasmid stabilization system protein ParE